jgi:hypothetical protein
MSEIRRTTGLCAVHIRGADVEVISEGQNSKAGSAITEQRVNVFHAKAGISECTKCNIDVNIPHGQERKVSSWVFINAGDIGRASNTHNALNRSKFGDSQLEQVQPFMGSVEVTQRM